MPFKILFFEFGDKALKSPGEVGTKYLKLRYQFDARPSHWDSGLGRKL